MKALAAVSALVLSMVPFAEGQWVIVARAVSGQIEHMQEKSSSGKGGYDVATVVVEAPAVKVYETALQRLHAHADQVTVTKENSKKRTVSFTNGTVTASLQANPLGDKLTQLIVASTLDPAQPDTTSVVVKSIQQVCTELKVECTLADQ